MEENYLQETLKINLRILIQDKVQKEIDEQVEEFRRKLEFRKDRYVSEIMDGIRICHESSPETNCINYKIIFENKYTKEEK